MPNECNIATETVPNDIPINYNMATEWDHRTGLNMTTERTEWFTEWHHERQPRKQPRDDLRDLTETDITAEGLHMEIERITGSPSVPSH